MKRTLGQIAHDAGQMAGKWQRCWADMPSGQRAEWEALAQAVASEVKYECCSKDDEIAELKRQLEEALKDAVEAGKKCDGLVVALERTLRWVDEMCQTGPEFGFEEIEKQANAAIEQAKGGAE